MSQAGARAWSQGEPERVRRLAVKAINEGLTYKEAAQRFGVWESTICNWMRRYREGGSEALEAGQRGRRPVEQMALQPWQQAQIAKTIRDKNPDQLQLPGFLWTRQAVRDLIERRFGSRLALQTIGKYLRRWGFTPQKPVRRAFEQSPAAVRTWLNEIYPKIAAKAKREKGQILWGDEMGLRSDHTTGRSWSPKGRTPVIEGTGQRFGANVISAISNQGRLYFSVFTGRMNAARFIDFLKRLIRQLKRKVFIIVDGHPSHRAKKVRSFVEDMGDRIALYYLPPYSPELNPDELLNQDVKSNALGRRRPESQDEMIADTRSHLRRRQRQPEVVARFFNEEHVSYAAAT